MGFKVYSPVVSCPQSLRRVYRVFHASGITEYTVVLTQHVHRRLQVTSGCDLHTLVFAQCNYPQCDKEMAYTACGFRLVGHTVV
jgi:hypothetical protein